MSLLENWVVNTLYVVDTHIYTSTDPTVAVQYQNKLFRAISEHTSLSFTTDFGNGLWEQIQVVGVKGDDGDKGDTGDQGIQGIAGNNGSVGPAGSNGIFSAIASQGEAEAGVENTKGMTSLRTSQAIIAQVPGLTVITDLQAEQVVQDATLSDHETRINVLEGLSTLSRARGEQRAENNIAAPKKLEGSLNPGDGGKGNEFAVDADGADSARIEVEIFREDDGETRFSTATLRAQFVNGAWLLARENTTILAGAPDGITFSINTVLVNKGEVSYTSDNMAGGNYKATSYVRWFIEEISNNF